MTKIRAVFILIYLFILGACNPFQSADSILVLTANSGFPYETTQVGVQALEDLGKAHNFEVVATSNPDYIHEDSLRNFKAVLFLNMKGSTLDSHQQAYLERFVQAGGGFVGVHAAIENSSAWGWYDAMLGATHAGYTSDTPPLTEAVLTVVDGAHPSTLHLADEWSRSERWIRLASTSDETEPLLEIESSGQPVAWIHQFDGGRVFYTGLGHSKEVFLDEEFLLHLAGGIEYALGDGVVLDYSKATTSLPIEEERFTKHVLINNLYEPMEFELLDNGKVLFIQRRGELLLFDPATEALNEVGRLDVHTEFEDGLIGLALDPNYEDNNWIYLYYSPVGNEAKQHLSRFVFENERLDVDSEVRLLEVQTQRRECCHAGGSIEFGPEGHLFLSTGDNVNPFASDGFGPMDERPGREPWDAQGSSANTNDLRGKILRILPRPDGTYDIPEGNLFPPGTPGTRPEIYVMGNRNPFRISIDQKTGYLYWGEVGPDSRADLPDRGPRGHDEVNQAREAGFFGWPLFVGDNKAYNDYNFQTQQSGPAFDPASPINASPNNTGIRELPPAQSAFIWYPYADSPEFPVLGNGGRNAMAGPVFYSDQYRDGDHTFPVMFDGRLFIYDWIRGWIMTVTMDENGHLSRIDRFMGDTEFANPIDMLFDEEGVMYVLEYGKTWYSRNEDARISRIEYNSGNLPPVVKISADTMPAGAVPLTMSFSTKGTFDREGDRLSYAWYFDNRESVQSSEAHPTFVFEHPGVFPVRVVVTDGAGNEVEETLIVTAGNEPPVVELGLEGNQTFFFDNASIPFRVQVEDIEDGTLQGGQIRPEEVFVQLDYLAEGYDKTLIAQGHQMADEATSFMSGKRIIEDSDCSSCHAVDRASVGPTYIQVAERYKEDDNAVSYLSDKIKNGGGGVWGEQAMAAHPNLSDDDLASIVAYILSLAEEDTAVENLGVEGELVTNAHLSEREKEGMYFVRAVYTDRGGTDVGPLAGQSLIVLRHPRIQAEAYDDAHNVGKPDEGILHELYDGSYLAFSGIDLTGINSLTFAVGSTHENAPGGMVEVRIGAPDGPVVGSLTVAPEDLSDQGKLLDLPIESQEGMQTVYVVFNAQTDSAIPLFALDWIEFKM